MQKIRVLLDSGSQRSYLTQRIRDKLALGSGSESTQKLSITSFGSKRAQDRPCDVVKIKIKTKSRPELELSLFVVPHICNPLTAQPASNLFRRYAHLSHLKFAYNNEQAYDFYQGLKALLREGSFNLRKFVTNSHSLQATIEQREAETKSSHKGNKHSMTTEPLDETYVEATMPLAVATPSGQQRVLGISWNVTTDRLSFDFRAIAMVARGLSSTKRNVISVVGKFVTPSCFSLLSRYGSRSSCKNCVCKLKLNWDEVLTGYLVSNWNGLVEQLNVSQPMTFPRCCLQSVSEFTQYRLCGFCDASTEAYAAVVYLLEETSDSKHSKFVVLKMRVLPLKAQTIPRLELLSALLLARLITNVADCLRCRFPLQGSRCFIDSQVALFGLLITSLPPEPSSILYYLELN